MTERKGAEREEPQQRKSSMPGGACDGRNQRNFCCLFLVSSAAYTLGPSSRDVCKPCTASLLATTTPLLRFLHLLLSLLPAPSLYVHLPDFLSVRPSVPPSPPHPYSPFLPLCPADLEDGLGNVFTLDQALVHVGGWGKFQKWHTLSM
eukprot:2114867-Rhodomonas_salina.2